jgi:DtxR family Mn-dependent transcriptional regulator
MLTLSEENYLKNIYHLQKENKEGVSTNSIAGSLQTKPSSVTDMIKKLSDKKLVDYKPYKGVTLTTKGTKAAALIIRKHRLWEVFLVEKLNFQWDEVHVIAEQLEHIKSDELINRLDTFLDHPEFDPHGDPIPDKHGNMKVTEKKVLSELKKNQQGIIVGVKETSSEFLQYLDKRNIEIGTKIKVLGKEFFDGSMIIQVRDQQFFISKKIAKNLFIQVSENV